jgi:hypothetical protein
MIKIFSRKRAKATGKAPHILEKIGAIITLTSLEITNNRNILENNKDLKGWVTIQKGTFHEDPSCEFINQNGKHGYYTYEKIVEDKPNLLTTAGRDWLHNQAYTNTSAGTRGAGFIVLSENASGASAGHTTVAGEITTDGLARADADTKTHTSSTNVSTIEHTFTASGAFTAVQLSGLLNAASVGTLVNENTFTPVALEIDDTLKVTWTITMG